MKILCPSNVNDTIVTSEYTAYQHEPSILKSEIRNAIQALRNNKSAGSDGIVAEMIKATGEYGIDTLHLICNKIWETAIWPTEWTESVYIPIHKKGAKEICTN